LVLAQFQSNVNQLYYGDNLPILRNRIATESVDLVYLDPPFNSNQDYNVLFKEQSGEPARAQIKAFTDTWEWSEKAYLEFCETCPSQMLVDLVQGVVKTVGRNDVTAYLVMMAPRIVELRRVLKLTGSLYLHCDPTASHYLKLCLDCVFGATNFRNEIIWKRTTVHSDSRTWSKVSDAILFYSKSDEFVWNLPYSAHSEEYLTSKYRYKDPDGRVYRLDNITSPNPRPNMMYEWKGHSSPQMGWRYSKETMAKLDAEGRIWYPDSKLKRPQLKRYLDEMPGTLMGNVWTDINPINSQAQERLGYPTQKPLALLERILEASSNKGDVVLDPFCGCGTAVVAAQKLKRRWIGIDITHLAISLIKYRLSDSFRLKEKRDYDVIGEPTTATEAEALALQDRDEFEKWAVGLVPRAFPFQDKRGADTGIDGVLRFRDDNTEPKRNVIQVKSGNLTLSAVRDFAHVIDREKATLGLLVTLDRPSKGMKLEADKMGFYRTPLGNRQIPRFQIRTIEQLLSGTPFDIPQTAALTTIKAAAEIVENKQIGLL
jgi:site-specific DNA-methyltransferase (adenine-specific)